MAISLIDVNPEVQTLFHQISFNQQVVDLVNAVIGNDCITLKETTAPSHTSGYGKIYVKSSDGKLYFKDDSGTEYDLTGVGVGGANTALSNLTTTSINESLIPQASKTLGDSSNRWTGLYSTFGNFSTTVDITGNLTVDTNVLFVNTSTNRVGINTLSPSYDLDVNGNTNIQNGYFYVRRTSGNPAITILSYSATSTDGSNLMLQRAKGGSFSSFTAVQSGDVLGAIQTLGATGANTWGNVNSQIQIVATENYTGSAYGCNMNFQVTTTGTTSRNTRFIIANDGSITVGSSSGTGTGSFFAGATTVTTLTGSGNVNIDSGTFFVDVTNNRIGISTASPLHLLHIVGGTLLTTKNSLYVTGTLPNPGGSTTERGVYFDITSAGSNNSAQLGLVIQLNSGFTGSRYTAAFSALNQAQGTTSDIIQYDGNFCYRGEATGTTTGANFGVFGRVANGNLNVAVYGLSIQDKVNAINVGVLGIGRNASSGGVMVGGYFGVYNTSPTMTSGALVCDNGSASVPIFVAKENGTIVFSILDGGNVNVDSGTFFIDISNNRVGINTASPSYSLHCVGTSYFSSTVTILSGQNIVSSASSNSFLTPDNGSGNALFASRSSIVLYIDYDNNQTDALLNINANNATTLWSMNELGAVDHTINTTTANGYTFSADSVTTGIMTRIISNSSNTSSRALLQIYNINTSATGAYPLLLTQNAVTSTNFKKYIVLDDVTIWKSDGTDPNGTLSGSAGDICLYATGTGGLKTCAGGTTWN